MKKKYNKVTINKEIIRGAYDKDNQWWFEEDIKNFSGGIIELSFGKTKDKIKIIEREK